MLVAGQNCLSMGAASWVMIVGPAKGRKRAQIPEVDYGRIVKTFSVTNLNEDPASSYTPGQQPGSSRRNLVGKTRRAEVICHRRARLKNRSRPTCI